MSRKQEHPIQYSVFLKTLEILQKLSVFNGFQVELMRKTEEDRPLLRNKNCAILCQSEWDKGA